jgi:hypothetical protein
LRIVKETLELAAQALSETIRELDASRFNADEVLEPILKMVLMALMPYTIATVAY